MEKTMFHSENEHSNRILYTPTMFAKNNLIYLQETGELNSRSGHKNHRSNLESYLFFIVLSGRGRIVYHGVEYAASEGDCFFINCNSEYSHQASDDNWTLKWIHFHGKSVSAIYDRFIALGGTNYFKSDRFSEYEALIDSVYQLASTDINTRDYKINEKLAALVTLLISECFEPSENENNKPARSLMPVKKYIEDNYMNKITLDELAEKHYINKFYLTRLFKKQFGISISSYIIQVRITHSKHLLRFTDFSLETIASECGFNNANYFARCFRKIEEISPGEFRKKW